MTLRGHVQNGVIVLDQPGLLPEGAIVQVEIVSPAVHGDSHPRTLLERLGPAVGQAEGLPQDAASNMKHYLYGHPRR
jgi:hypothetical protein